MLRRGQTVQDVEEMLDMADELVWASELLDTKIRERLWWSKELELMVNGKLDVGGRDNIKGSRAGFGAELTRATIWLK